jgi:hypothetical protein
MSISGGTVLWIAAAVGIALALVGLFFGMPEVTEAGGIVLVLPVIFAFARIVKNPPDIGETINAEMIGLPKYDKPVELSESEAKAALRDTGGERRPK